jgi:nucleotide-binding universal stress UspA family protein
MSAGAGEELAKDLGLLSALTIGGGTVTGAGIFVLPGEAAAEDATLLVMGATEQGPVRRLFGGWLVPDVVADAGCSVLVAETATERGLVDRLFG